MYGVASCRFVRKRDRHDRRFPSDSIRTALRAACLTGAWLVASRNLPAQVRLPEPGRLISVNDSASGRPVGSAELVIGGIPRTRTSELGLAWLPDTVVVSGAWLVARAVGFAPDSVRTETLSGDTTRIAMRRLVDLPTVAIEGISEGFAGFNARCGFRGVVCFKADELAARPSARISDYIARVSGNERRCAGRLDNCIVLMRSSGGGRCVPSYYVDGVVVRPLPATGRGGGASGVLADMERFLTPIQIRGIEVYRGGQPIPARFEPGTGCGAIVIWTR